MKNFTILVFLLISLSVEAQTPGGVSSNLKAWYKADGNVPVSGTNVTAWNNQVAGGVNVTSIGGTPQLTAAGLNFNPTVYLNGSSYLYSNNVAGSNYISASNNSAFIVFTKVLPFDVGNSEIIAKWNLAPTNRTTWEIEPPTGLLRFDFPSSGAGKGIGTTVVSPLSFIGSATTDVTFDSLNLNGLNERVKTITGLVANPTALGPYMIGADNLGAYTYLGHIAEIIYYDSHLTYSSRRRVESYLGIKYGITLGNTTNPIDYLASDPTIKTWNKSVVYQNHVAGIGRDDAASLNQKQGTSQNVTSLVTMALGSIATTNILNTNTFPVDKSYLVWGDDNTSLSSAGVTDFSAPVLARIQRVWRSQETGTLGTVKLRISLAAVTLATGCSSLNSYRLMVDGDGVFASGATLIAPSAYNVGAQWVEFDVDFTPAIGFYFTLGRVADVLPMAVLSGTNTSCAGASTNLSVALTGVSPWNITYTDGTTPKTISGITASPYFFSVSPVSTKTYSVTAVSDFYCSGISMTGTPIVTVNPLPTSTLSGTAAICAGASTNLSVVLTGTQPWSISYTDGTTPTTITGITTSPYSISVSPASTKTFSVTAVSDVNCTGTSMTGTPMVSINPSPTATLSGSTSICAGLSTNLTATLTGTQPWSLTYTDGTTPVTVSGITASPYDLSVSPVANKNYLLTAVSDGSCTGTFSGTAAIAVNPYIAFNAATYSTIEALPTNPPRLIIKGVIVNPSTVTISVTTSATAGVDYTLTQTTITIPAGTYDGTTATGIALPFTVIDDAISETTETVKFDIISATGDISTSTTTCNLGIKTSVYTIYDDDCAKPALGPDKIYCQGVVINQTLTGPVGNDYYKWKKIENSADTSFSVNYTATSPGTYILKTGKFGGNLITNGDFSSGNTGFTTGYAYTTGNFPAGVGGKYNIVADNTNNTWAYNAKDHTTGTGKFMFIDGNSVLGIKVWSQNITVVPNTDYFFSAWVHNLSPAGNNDPQLNFDINGANIGGTYNVFSDVDGAIGRKWNQFYTTWNSGSNTNITISIEDNVTGSYNDFAIDDIYFSNNGCSYSDTIVIAQPLNPVVTVPANYSICNNSNTTATNFTSVATGTVTYTWTNSATSIGLAASGTGNLPIFTATNTTNSPITASIVVTPTANGCPGLPKTFTITVNPTPTASLSGANSICAGLSTNLTATLTGTQPWSLTYTDGTTPVTISGITASPYVFGVSPASTKTYSITAIGDVNCNGTSMTGTPMVTVKPLPTSILTGTISGCSGTTNIKLSVGLTGTSPWSYTYFDGTTSTSVTGVASTPDKIYLPALTTTKTYTITAVSDAFCTGTSMTGAATVTVTPGPTATLSGTSTVCAGASANLTVVLTGAQPWNMTYTDGTTPVTVSGITASPYVFGVSPASTKTYSITAVSDVNCNGTSMTGTPMVTVNPTPTASLSGATSICAGLSTNLTATLTGTQPWSLTYTDGTTPVTVSGITASPYVFSVSPASTKTYSITAVSDVNCTGTFSGTALVSVTSKPTLVLSGNASICEGASANLTATLTGTQPWYLTYTDGTTPVTIAGITASPYVINVNPATTKTYLITALNDASCNGTFSGTPTITVNPLPNVKALTSAKSVCAGGSVTLSGSGASTYVWDNSVSNNAPFTPIVTTLYTVKATDINNCFATDTITVVVNPLPAAPVVAHAKVCLNSTPAPDLTLNVTGSNIKWYAAASGGSSMAVPVVNTAVVGITSYYVSQTNSLGCESARTKIDVDVSDIPYAQFTSTNLNYCEGTGGVNLTVKDDGVNSVYEWYKDGVSQGPSGDAIDFSGAVAGDWTVKVTNKLTGCTANSTVATVVEDPTPLAVITTSGAALEYCANHPSGITLLASDAGSNMTYEWFKDNVSQTTASVINRSLSNVFAGVWTVKVVNTLTTCPSISSPVTVNAKPVPVATITNTGSNSDYCKGNPGILLTAQSVTGAFYEWFKDGASVGTGLTHNNSLAGDWWLNVTLNGCADTSIVFKVTEKPLPIAEITPSAMSYCAGVNGVTLTATAAGSNASYEWFKDATSQGAANTNLVFNNALAADWTLQVILNGCNATSVITTITENPLPEAEITTIGEALKYCAGTNGVTLTAKDQGVGASYEWYLDGVLISTTATNTLSNALKGNWTMKVTKGCSATTILSTPVTEKPLPIASITSTLLDYCAGNAGVTLTANSVAGASYEWFKSGVSLGAATFTNTYNNVFLGDYTVKVSLNNCDVTSTISTVVENVLPTASISGTGAICDSTTNAPLTITLSGKAPWNIVYQKPDGATITSNGIFTSPFVVNESLNGTYKVLTVSDAICIGTVSGTAKITYKTSPTITNATRTCTPSMTSFVVQFDIASGDASSYIVTGATGTLAGNTWTSDPLSEAVIASITVTDANNCKPYTENFSKSCSCPADGLLSGGGTICNDGITKANMTITLEGASPWNIEYTVDNGVAQSITGIMSSPYSFASSSKGVYQLTKVQDKNCLGSANGTAIVNYYNFPTAVIVGNSNICVGKENANLTINFTGKSPWDFTVVEPSGNKTLTGITANPYTYVANTVGNYTMSSIKDANCVGRNVDISGTAAIVAYSKPDSSNVKLICDNSNKFYITMDIIGGDPATYQVTGAQGSLVGNQWTSAMIVSGTLTSLSLTDAKNCFPIMIPNLDKNCLCPAAATMSGDKTFCADGTKANVTIALQGLSPWNLTYRINNGSPVAVTTTSNPLVINNIDKSSTYYLLSVSDDKCTGTVSGTATIVVNELPTAIVTGGGTACAGAAVSKVTFNLTGAAPYNLTYSDGSTSPSVVSASSKYQINAPTQGNYTAVNVTDANGCVATKLLGTAVVQFLPVSTATIVGAAGICYGDQTPITITFMNVNNAPFKLTYDGGSGYQIIAGITTNPYSINLSPQQTTNFKIIELLDKYNCSNKTITDSVRVEVTKIPVFNINNNVPVICSGIKTSIRFVSNVIGTSYSWVATAPATVSGIVQPATGDSISQYLSNNANVIEKVTYTVTPTAFTTSNKACVGNPKSVDVFVRRPTIPELGLDRDGLCVGESVVIDAGNFPSGKYSWFVNDVKTKDTLSQKNIVVPMGTTKISVGYINTCGLPFKDSVRFTSKQNVAIYFDRGDTCLGINTSFIPHQITTEENVTSWGWKMVNTGDSANSTALNPSYSYVFPNTGKQLVHLTAYSDGCKIGDTTRVINIKNCAIKVENVFTPNGDGHNDAWRIEGIEDFPNANIVIFNRWGVIVHHIPGTALVPWDGTNDSGQLLESGTFYYVITLNKVSGSNQIVKGCVTIITE